MFPSLSARSAIVGLLAPALAIAGCDKGSPANEQAAQAANPSPDEASPDEAPAGPPAPRAGAVDRSHKGERAPDVAISDAAGDRTTLRAATGTPLLVNLWATWCAPCVKELPTLDAAARATAGRLSVVAVSQDMDAGKAKAFLATKPFAAIRPLFDPKLGLSLAYQANLPTTILYGSNGRELWRVTGELDWTGTKAKALLAEAR
ncbi:TlpA family protein disulfide reductase [Sphingomonas sp. Leaf412]|uniref:TlpA family protein disulfide reductase n=1 Tax=Sphingomonas sp. Leaf412 TaxID=1736370 RepID=UPI000A7C5388|nr:TlpA disulfide reductase family protein [Sphingomonas sp. Leaf412]